MTSADLRAFALRITPRKPSTVCFANGFVFLIATALSVGHNIPVAAGLLGWSGGMFIGMGIVFSDRDA